MPRYPPMLQATLNGPLTKADHGAVPVTLEELAVDSAACAAEGARAFHIHPRDDSGRESLQARVVDRVVSAVRQAHGLPVGVTTGEWIEPDLEHRRQLIREWTQPDYASVNLSEPGAVEVIHALLDTGTGIEAGIWTVEDAVRRGVDTRVGFEDTLLLPDGQPARGNADLIRAARELGAGRP